MLLTLLVCAHMQETAVATRPALEEGSGGGRLLAGDGQGANSSTQTSWIRIQNELGTKVKITLEFPADQVAYLYGDCEADKVFEREITPQVAMNVGVTVIPPGFTGEVPSVSPAGEALKAAMFWGGHVYTVATIGSSGTMVAGLQEALKSFATKVATAVAKDVATDVKDKVVNAVSGVSPALWPFKYFREVWPSTDKAAVTKLVWKDAAEGIVLDGVHKQCESDEEVFWGCCYKRCSAMTGNKHPFRCSFNRCGKDKECNILTTSTDGFICDGYAVGFGEHPPLNTKTRCCRKPSSDKYEGVGKTK